LAPNKFTSGQQDKRERERWERKGKERKENRGEGKE